jgi:hypothetical protein
LLPIVELAKPYDGIVIAYSRVYKISERGREPLFAHMAVYIVFGKDQKGFGIDVTHEKVFSIRTYIVV